jgi:iduronate 2-sulfatase
MSPKSADRRGYGLPRPHRNCPPDRAGSGERPINFSPADRVIRFRIEMHYPSRRSFLRTAGLATAAATLPAQQPPGKYNVLFIAVDDLKPALGCYGDPLAVTPNIDRLAARGLLFTRAYCQQAVCSPSRTSLLLGRRPDTTTIYDLEHHFRGAHPDATTLPQHFKNHGYVTASLSKIWHGGLEDGRSNTIPHWTPNSPGPWGSLENALAQTRREAAVIAGGWRADTAAQRERRTGQPTVRGPVWASRDVPDNQMPDGRTAEMAVQALHKLKNDRFFLMTGFLRPHLPFVAPKRFFDMHPREKFSLAAFREKPAGTPDFAMHVNGELRTYDITPKEGPIPESLQLDLIRAYYAAASYTDACVGKLLDALESNGLR